MLASLLAFAQAPARHALKESSLIVPGRSVGGLDLGDDRARTLQLFPKKPNMDEEYKYPFCGGYSEIHWLDFEKKIDGVFVYLKAERVIQIESATPRFRTREGITIYSSPELLRKHFPEMRAFVLLNSGGTVNGGKDLIYWVDQKRGIAFELYYDRRVRNRRVWKTIVFNPGTEFQPEGCVVEPQTWHELEPYALDPLRNLNKESSRNVDQSRLWSTLEKLSEFGRPVGADFDAGVTRVGFSDAELAAREYVMGLMRDAGLAVR
ncbi:MAG: hypothetical protein HY233_12460, partial [Acidobacteriales bacterium]|nr:hypothetical protein [Terriglobales bacterium]